MNYELLTNNPLLPILRALKLEKPKYDLSLEKGDGLVKEDISKGLFAALGFCGHIGNHLDLLVQQRNVISTNCLGELFQ